MIEETESNFDFFFCTFVVSVSHFILLRIEYDSSSVSCIFIKFSMGDSIGISI